MTAGVLLAGIAVGLGASCAGASIFEISGRKINGYVFCEALDPTDCSSSWVGSSVGVVVRVGCGVGVNTWVGARIDTVVNVVVGVAVGANVGTAVDIAVLVSVGTTCWAQIWSKDANGGGFD